MCVDDAFITRKINVSIEMDSPKWFYTAMSQHMYLQVAFVLKHFSTSITRGRGNNVFVMDLLHMSL